jgi:hypothetical protein
LEDDFARLEVTTAALHVAETPTMLAVVSAFTAPSVPEPLSFWDRDGER